MAYQSHHNQNIFKSIHSVYPAYYFAGHTAETLCSHVYISRCWFKQVQGLKRDDKANKYKQYSSYHSWRQCIDLCTSPLHHIDHIVFAYDCDMHAFHRSFCNQWQNAQHNAQLTANWGWFPAGCEGVGIRILQTAWEIGEQRSGGARVKSMTVVMCTWHHKTSGVTMRSYTLAADVYTSPSSMTKKHKTNQIHELPPWIMLEKSNSANSSRHFGVSGFNSDQFQGIQLTQARGTGFILTANALGSR